MDAATYGGLAGAIDECRTREDIELLLARMLRAHPTDLTMINLVERAAQRRLAIDRGLASGSCPGVRSSRVIGPHG